MEYKVRINDRYRASNFNDWTGDRWGDGAVKRFRVSLIIWFLELLRIDSGGGIGGSVAGQVLEWRIYKGRWRHRV
jgi:hypothetical protein